MDAALFFFLLKLCKSYSFTQKFLQSSSRSLISTTHITGVMHVYVKEQAVFNHIPIISQFLFTV